MYINNSNFKTKIELFNPLSLDYKTFWKEERRRCIEGYWIGGRYMPGPVYQYINHWKIELNKGKNSKNKVIDHPFLRDLEWEKGYLFMEARGFSGFEYDKYNTCIRSLKGELMFHDEYENKRIITPTELEIALINEQPKRFKQIFYQEARDYLKWNHKENLGRPLMENDARNVVDIEARGGGKSFFASNLIGWNFLHDGVFAYEDLRDKPKSETLIGAIDTKYSSGLIKKVKLGLENLTGGIELGDIYYPAPFSKKYSGSWESGKTILAEYEQKIGSNWTKRGSKSMIHHRSFADNPMAANGTRPGFTCLEEVGFMHNLLLALGQLKECTMNGSEKFGTIWMFGTGGDMAGGSTEAVKDVFYNPEGYDCLVFNDEYENKGKIGYFVPAWKTLNQFKNDEGVTNELVAKEFLEKERVKLANGKSKQPLYDELQNRPVVPSEAFLVLQGNIFPIAELKEHLSNIESNQRLLEASATGWMQRDKEGKATFKVDHDLYVTDYPTKYSKDPRGAVEIWEQPIENPGYGLYIAGIDSIDQDQADSSSSMGSIIIYKRLKDSGSTFHLPVAEYTGRPEFASDFYEQCRRLLEYYNAKALYENQTPGIKAYFETKNCLHLLARQPAIIKSISPSSKVDRVFGTHMTNQIKDAIEIMTRDWLKTELEPGKLQLTKIYSIPLLKELIAYNKDGNFDRVIAFMLVMMQDLELHNVTQEEVQEDLEKDGFFSRRLFTNYSRVVNY
jgi:hypothetical protein